MPHGEQGASLATPVQGAQEPSLSMRIAVVLREDLEPWQRLNVTAFTISGVASRPGAVGQDYLDASGNRYLAMFPRPGAGLRRQRRGDGPHRRTRAQTRVAVVHQYAGSVRHLQ